MSLLAMAVPAALAQALKETLDPMGRLPPSGLFKLQAAKVDW
jgi:hypothetical protein